MNKKQIAITLGVMCFLLTIAICVQLRTMSSASSTVSQTLSDNGLRDEVLKMKEKYDNAYRELENAQKELEKIRQEATQNDSTSEAKEQELRENNILLGNTDVKGDGLEDAKNANSINPSYQIIHFGDIQDVVNELKNAGAEAIEINGQRLVNTSAITCEGNIIKINGERVGSPFHIRAIGSQSLLYGALTRAGSCLDIIREYGNTAEVTRVDDITIQKYAGSITYKYMKEDK